MVKDLRYMLLQIYVAKIHVATDTCCYRYLLLQVLLLPMSNVLYFYTSTSRSVVFPVGKGDRYVRLTTLPPSCAVVMKSGNLSILEPSGPFQACNGTALPLPLTAVNQYTSNIVVKYVTLPFLIRVDTC